jgi:hypothetical protein
MAWAAHPAGHGGRLCRASVDRRRRFGSDHRGGSTAFTGSAPLRRGHCHALPRRRRDQGQGGHGSRHSANGCRAAGVPGAAGAGARGGLLAAHRDGRLSQLAAGKERSARRAADAHHFAAASAAAAGPCGGHLRGDYQGGAAARGPVAAEDSGQARALAEAVSFGQPLHQRGSSEDSRSGPCGALSA